MEGESNVNKVVLMGRLTRDPETRYSSGENPIAVSRYTLAVDRRFKRDNEQTTDFIRCVAFGKNGEFAEKYLRQGVKIIASGRIQTGSYINKEGNKVYTTEVVVVEQEFAESKKNASRSTTDSFLNAPEDAAGPDGFINIPDALEEELPFA